MRSYDCGVLLGMDIIHIHGIKDCRKGNVLKIKPVQPV